MLHLSAAVDQPSAYDAASYLTLVRLAERGGLDFVTLEDSFARPGPDALAVLARLAPATSRIGLVPTVTTTHTEPFHVQAAVATLDWVSRGRAGWRIDVSSTEGEARLFGRRQAAPPDALWQEAGEVADVAAMLWDSWEDDAEIRDVPTGRFVDRDKLHHVDFRGTSFSVKGPSIVPRPPQGHPVRVVDATDGAARGTAARYADVALVRAAGVPQAAAVRAALRRRGTAERRPRSDRGRTGGVRRAQAGRAGARRRMGRKGLRPRRPRPAGVPRHRGHTVRSALVGAGALHAVRRAADRARAERGRGRARARARRRSDVRARRTGADAEGRGPGRRLAVGGFRRYDERRRQLPVPVPVPLRAGRRRPYDGRLQPGAAAALRLRRPLHLPVPAAREHPGRRRRRGGAQPGPVSGRFTRTAKVLQSLTAERRPCAYRPLGRILPLSACQGHGVFEIRTAGPLTAPHGPRPHAGPRLPLGGNET
ncbi:LLM class flavin-dependent oxidoreductase [Streptomyces canus]|uniref:LLM class flavin-dependent oxidoreductase n=1 Tax=Streptomyces canus TaxID=58343 RepID=UPI003F4C8D57